jgi:hypothetical protein
MEKLIVEPPAGFNPKTDSLFYASEKVGALEVPFKLQKIKPLKSREEIRAKRREYRRQYSQRPEVQAKIKKRLSDPNVIAKRKEYSERKEVKERKKQLALRARQIKSKLKETYPEIYEELVGELNQ